MYKELETKLFNALKAEFDYVVKNETDKRIKKEKLIEILQLQKVIAEFDKLEPFIAEYFDKKAEKGRFER